MFLETVNDIFLIAETVYNPAVLVAAGILAARLATWMLDIESYKLRPFVKKILELFRAQSRNNSQFAVLFLSSKQDITTTEFRTRSGPISTSEEATDNRHPLFPPRHSRCSFITARPDGHLHAEERILDYYNLLMTDYKRLNMPACQAIVLYSWFLPSQYSAGKIIHKLCRTGYPVVVMYSAREDGASDVAESQIVQRLKQAGVSVKKVAFEINH